MSNYHNICLLNDAFPPIIDGVANAVYNYGRCIEQNHGHSVVVTPEVPGSDDSIYDFTVVRYPSIDTRKMMGYVTGYPFSPEAAHRIEEEHVELMHTHCPVMSAVLAKDLAEAMHVPLVLTWHTKYDIDIANMIRSRMLQEGAIRALMVNVNACDEVWAVSRGAGENLKSLGYEGDVLVMPNGVDLPHEPVSQSLIDEVTSGYDLPADVPVFLFTGRMMWYKGLRIILDALDMLRAEGTDFRMVFVGGGGDEEEVREYTAELGLNGSVIFAGPVYDRELLRAWYSRADLFLFPSTFDTNGLVVREAAASDTASVIIADSCASEGVTDGRNGFLIEENAEALAAKLREVLADPEIMKTVGEGAGRELYISWDDAVAHAYDRYEIVLDNYKRGVYGSHDLLRGSLNQSRGEMMQLLGDFDAARKSMTDAAETRYTEIEQAMRSHQNRIMTDIITAGYETRQDVINFTDELVNRVQEAADNILDAFDRYL